MSSILDIEPREQAGSDSYNRFEYQVHWIVCHIIGCLDKAEECIIFCEFHDDMTEFSPDCNKCQFYQIKTKEDVDEWTIADLSKREKKKSGGYKKSFLGFLFYNFLMFGTECQSCHFVSNNDFDKDVIEWQAYIEDGEVVEKENPELYKRIKKRISDEYADSMPANFDEVYNRFIQNTFLHKSELQLSTYEEQVSGKFFNKLADINIPSNTAHLIFQQLVNDVRKKSKEKVRVPISLKRLIDKKGIETLKINEKINNSISNKGNYQNFGAFLNTLPLSPEDITRIRNSKTLHDSRWLDVNDLKYQESVIVLRKTISEYIDIKDVFDNEIKQKCDQTLQECELSSCSIDDNLYEVLYYEQKFSKSN